MEKKILHLTLKKKWFDMILSGQKKEEYREIKKYWTKRLYGGALDPIPEYDIIRFTNGYGKKCPTMDVEYISVYRGQGTQAWGAPAYQTVYIISLGEIISTANITTSHVDKRGE